MHGNISGGNVGGGGHLLAVGGQTVVEVGGGMFGYTMPTMVRMGAAAIGAGAGEL